jgi:hypothetical protein
MKKLTDREIERLLSARAMPEPPGGLADRIKAEIPEVLQVGGTGLEPENVRAMPPRSAGFRPLWLIAASLLVVIGAGFMAVRLLGPSEDLARQIALDGVIVIEDVVVTVPERGAGEKQKLASVMAVAKSPKKGERPVAPSKARGISKDESATPGKIQPAAEGESRETMTVVAAGAANEPAALMPQNRVTEEVVIAGHPEVSGEARSVGAADTMGRAAAPVPEAAGSIVVVVQDNVGKPVVGASVQLECGDRPNVSSGSKKTGADGAATFCCVVPGSYRICAQLPGYLAATNEVVVTSGTHLNVPLTLDRPPTDGKEHPWTCPTPTPPASR